MVASAREQDLKTGVKQLGLGPPVRLAFLSLGLKNIDKKKNVLDSIFLSLQIKWFPD